MTLHTGIKFKTSAALTTIEDWLEENTKGDWDVEIEDIETQVGQKTLSVYFELDSDRDAFKAVAKTFS